MTRIDHAGAFWDRVLMTTDLAVHVTNFQRDARP